MSSDILWQASRSKVILHTLIICNAADQTAQVYGRIFKIILEIVVDVGDEVVELIYSYATYYSFLLPLKAFDA